MRLGGGIEKKYNSPEEWVSFAKDLRYSAVLCPVDSGSDAATRKDYLKAAKEADLLIGEVGVWKNCLSTDDAERKTAMDYAKAQLALSDEMGANCCVNIMGSQNAQSWDGFSLDNYSQDFYALAVDSVREIIDAVKPTYTFYSIEPMPWCVPDSPEQYLKLLKDVDRKAFAVHLDFVNMINCPERYCRSTDFIQHCFDLLGPYIKSIHGKDVFMEQAYTTLIHETMPGKGTLDYQKIVGMVEKLGPDTPLFVEHLSDYETYRTAVNYVRSQAEKAGVRVL
ncbi:MAG: sugar phosphate isomerase/epimerase [Treponema sp.]|nr:sugar phosphate isomerase/epimerase [Treponema sp.]